MNREIHTDFYPIADPNQKVLFWIVNRKILTSLKKASSAACSHKGDIDKFRSERNAIQGRDIGCSFCRGIRCRWTMQSPGAKASYRKYRLKTVKDQKLVIQPGKSMD